MERQDRKGKEINMKHNRMFQELDKWAGNEIRVLDTSRRLIVEGVLSNKQGRYLCLPHQGYFVGEITIPMHLIKLFLLSGESSRDLIIDPDYLEKGTPLYREEVV